MADKISQIDFLKQLKSQMPELKDFSDDEILKRVLQRKPEIRNQVELLTDRVKQDQTTMEKRAGSIIDPETWQRHPNIGNFIKSVTGSLPGVGGIAGGILSTPETGGFGTIPGVALGAAAGKGLQDIANQGLGLDYTTPSQKAMNVGKEGSITALLSGLVPGLYEWGTDPIGSARTTAGMLNNAPGAILPKWLKPFVNSSMLEDFAAGPKPTGGMGTTARPPWQSYDKPYSVRSSPIPKKSTAPPWFTEGEFTEAPTDMTTTRPFNPSGQTGLTVKPTPEPSVTVEGPRRIGGSTGQTGPDIIGTPKEIGPDARTGPDVLGNQKQLKSEFDVTTEPIIQHSPSNPGTLRGSLDGGKTWKYSTDGGQTWDWNEP